MKPRHYVPPRVACEVTRLCQLQRDGAICARPAHLGVGPDDLMPVCDDCYCRLLEIQRRTSGATADA